MRLFPSMFLQVVTFVHLELTYFPQVHVHTKIIIKQLFFGGKLGDRRCSFLMGDLESKCSQRLPWVQESGRKSPKEIKKFSQENSTEFIDSSPTVLFNQRYCVICIYFITHLVFSLQLDCEFLKCRNYVFYFFNIPTGLLCNVWDIVYIQ